MNWLPHADLPGVPTFPTLPTLPDRLSPPVPPVVATRPSPIHAARPAEPNKARGCAVCSRLPADTFPIQRQVGLVFLRKTVRSSEVLCREHGTKRSRAFLARTLVQGWWGIISFFVNFLAIAHDLSAWSHYSRLAPPQGLATEGRPLTRQRQVPFGSKRRLTGLIHAIVALIVLGALVGFVGHALRS